MESKKTRSRYVMWQRGSTGVFRNLLEHRPANVDVFREILTYMFPSGIAFPSVEALSKGTGHSSRTVMRAINSIRKSGLLEEKGYRERSIAWSLSPLGRQLVTGGRAFDDAH